MQSAIADDAKVLADARVLRKFFAKMSKNELGGVIPLLKLDIPEEEWALPKAKLLEAVVGEFSAGITFSQIALADTFYMHAHASKKWQALQLCTDGGELKIPGSVGTLQAQLRSTLRT